MTLERVCARCSIALAPGKTPFFEVQIEAVSNPGTPDLNDLAAECHDPAQGIEDPAGSENQ